MVRRGSTVRVRQRALQKPRKARLFFRTGSARLPREEGLEHFMELPSRERASWARRGGRQDPELGQCSRMTTGAVPERQGTATRLFWCLGVGGRGGCRQACAGRDRAAGYLLDGASGVDA